MKTKNTKHTPGPWKVAEDDSCCILARGKHIITAHDTDGGRSETGRGSRNARLIAAAPEMLEALETILKAFAPNGTEGLRLNQQNAIGRAMNAVNRAKGGAA